MKENKKMKISALEAEKQGRLKAFVKSRKSRHGAASIAIIAIIVALVIVLNIVCGLLTDRFPNLKLDLTANQAFALQEDTVDYVSHLQKDIEVNILLSEDDFEKFGTYFVQAKNLLEKMESSSKGRLKVNYIDLVTDPNFASKYPDADLNNTKNVVALVTCGEQYKVLTLEECFVYDETLVESYGYQYTATTIEQAVVTAILNVTTEDKTVVNMITGNNEQDYSAVKKLLEDNAYKVNEVSLVTGEIEKDAEILMLFAPSVDLDETATDKISTWLDNEGKYGRTFIFVPSMESIDTPNLDALLDKWGMQVSKGIVFETSSEYLVSNNTVFSFLTDYTDYYVDGLKNPSIPTVTTTTHDIIIKDTEMAHGILVTSDGAGVQPVDADENWDYKDAISGEPLNVAAEGIVTNNDNTSSRVLVFGSYAYFDEDIMSYNSFNNSGYFINTVNTISNKTDVGITIESKSLNSAELGITDVSTIMTMLIIFVIAIPVIILVVGIVIWLRRRNK